MTLREAKQAIRAYIQTKPEQRVAEVYAFNQDGKMDADNGCTCLLGTMSAAKLHVRLILATCPELDCGMHYLREREVDGARWAENGYICLSSYPDIRRRRFSAILRAELRLRARARKVQERREQLIFLAGLAAMSERLDPEAFRSRFCVELSELQPPISR